MFAGRQLRIRIGSTVVAGAQTDTITINREPINVTDKDDEGVQRLLPEAGTYAIEGTIEGYIRSRQFLQDIQDASPTNPVLIQFDLQVANVGLFRGSWFVSSFETSGTEGAEAIQFSATIASAGNVQFATAWFTDVHVIGLIGTGVAQRLLYALESTQPIDTNFNDFDAAFSVSNSFVVGAPVGIQFGVGETVPEGLAFAADGTLYMIGSAADALYTVNTTTGVATRVGSATEFGVGETAPQGLAFAADGTLYMIGSTAGALYTVNTTTGVATRVGSATEFGVGESLPMGLAFAADGTLYMIGSTAGALYTVNTTTGVATRVGSATEFGVGESLPEGLAFAADGTLYMIGSAADALYTVNTTTGVATRVGSATEFGVGETAPQGLAFAADGTLYMIGSTADALYTVNTTTGVATPAFNYVTVNRDNPGAASFAGYTGTVTLSLDPGHSIVSALSGTPLINTISRFPSRVVEFQNGVIQT